MWSFFSHAGVGLVPGVDQGGVDHLLYPGGLGGVHHVLVGVLPLGPHKGHGDQRQAVRAGKSLLQSIGEVEVGDVGLHAHVRVFLQCGLAVAAENQVVHRLQLQQVFRRLAAQIAVHTCQ